jgi:hypothetical protein
MTEVSFTGDLNYVTYLIEKYKKDGYVYKEGVQSKKSPITYRVVMMKKEEQPNRVTIFIDGKPVVYTITGTENPFERFMRDTTPKEGLQGIIGEKPLAEQLTEAVEREDYETAAILRDKIKQL